MRSILCNPSQRGHLCAVENFVIPPTMAGLSARIGFEKFQKSDKLGRAGLRSVLMVGSRNETCWVKYGPLLLALFNGQNRPRSI